jgi:hypothetical protein
MEYIRDPPKIGQRYSVLESNRHRVTSRMGNYLKKHYITENTYFTRINGYRIVTKGSESRQYTKGDA